MPIVASSCEILTDYFYEKPFPAKFCAQLDVPAAGVPVTFTAMTPYWIMYTVGPRITNSQGIACASVNWPQGIYTVTATAGAETCTSSVSIFSELNFCGAQGGGALLLDDYGVPPNVMTSLDNRIADFAFIYRETPPKNFGIIFHDPDYPLGAITFIAKSFATVQSMDNIAYQTMEFNGIGKFTQGANPTKNVRYNLFVDDFPNDSYFCLQIRDFAGHLLYENTNCTLFEGQNVVELCPD